LLCKDCIANSCLQMMFVNGKYEFVNCKKLNRYIDGNNSASCLASWIVEVFVGY